MNQIIASQVFAKKAGWAAEDLGNTPVHLKKNQSANARDGSSTLNDEAYMSALQVRCLVHLHHPCLQTKPSIAIKFLKPASRAPVD